MLDIQPNGTRSIDEMKISGTCPACHKEVHFTPLWSTPINTLRQRARGSIIPKMTTVWSCDNCLANLYVEWSTTSLADGNPHFTLPTVINIKYYTIDDEFVPATVKDDLTEALKCLSLDCPNAFAAMCRRTIQSMCMQEGVTGTTKVQDQVAEFKRMLSIESGSDDDKLLSALMIAGHDGAHPHLPKVDAARAEILLTLLKDLVEQIFNRPGRIKKAVEAREKAVAEKKTS